METITIEIDQEGLRAYRVKQGRWLIPFLVCVVPISLAVLAASPNDPQMFPYETARQMWLTIAAYGIGALLVSIPIGLLIQYLTIARRATKYAASYNASVDGPYLRIVRDGFTYEDRKLHFNSLCDYTVYQDFEMRRAGIKSIRISRQSNNAPRTNTSVTIEILAVRDAEKVRDLLCMLDAEREDQAA